MPSSLISSSFSTSVLIGLIVLTKNYLEVYTYDKWTGRHLPHFEEGEEFMPSICELREGQTTKPNLLTEADLVTLMDKNGIGKCLVRGTQILLGLAYND